MATFRSLAGDQLAVRPDADGVLLELRPVTPPFAARAPELQRLGLRRASLLQLRDALRRGGIFVTDDRAVAATVRDGRLSLSFAEVDA